MANNEAEFKKEFRDALEAHYKKDAEVWTNNDMFRSGLPDFSVSWNSHFFPIEAKFIKELPRRTTTGVLKHEVSPLQYNFLKRIWNTGNMSAVLVGMPDVAVVIPFSLWPRPPFDGAQVSNIIHSDFMAIASNGYRINKIRGMWQVEGFLERIVKAHG